MMSKLFALAGLWLFSIASMAMADQELIDNLRSRQIALPANRGTLIKSFETHSQSYIYDQALAIITFSKHKDQKSAKALLNALAHLQLPDGSLYFSYNLEGSSPYPLEGDRRFAGAIAWVALAAVHYQAEFRSKEFVPFNLKILSWLRSEMRPITGKNFEALRFGPSDLSVSPWKENETIALEHNLDAYAAFRNFTKLNPTHTWTKEVKHLEKFIFSMWDKNRSHFWSGANYVTGKINRDELYLDNQTWSLLALEEKLWKDLDAPKALALNCESLYVERDGVSGFCDSKPANGPKRYEFVWSEGTLGQVLAMEKAGFQCDQKSTQEILSSVKKMQKADGGIAYATKTSNPDFTTSSSVAGTTWMYFATNKINPFSVEASPKKSPPLLSRSGR